jgi:hypothetical protein
MIIRELIVRYLVEKNDTLSSEVFPSRVEISRSITGGKRH